MNLFEMYNSGGPYMNLISIMALVTIFVAVLKIISIINKKELDFRLLDFILMSGSLALAIGMMGQMVGITEALEAIREAADVSPQIVMTGALISFYAPIWGFIVFIFSILIYFVLKEVIKARKG